MQFLRVVKRMTINDLGGAEKIETCIFSHFLAVVNSSGHRFPNDSLLLISSPLGDD